MAYKKMVRNKAVFVISLQDGRKERVKVVDEGLTVDVDHIFERSKLINSIDRDDIDMIEKIRVINNDGFHRFNFVVCGLKTLEFEDGISLDSLNLFGIGHNRNLGKYVVNTPKDIKYINCSVNDHIEGLDEMFEKRKDLFVNIGRPGEISV